MKQPERREQIIEVADRLFYEQGYDHTSFADIAKAVKISRGNFYYHFKTKDEILAAVIAFRKVRTKAMLERWEQQGDSPEKRINCFIQILIANQAKILRHGCPVGTLTTELAKLGHHSQASASEIFTLFREWLCKQFEDLGRVEDADQLAMQLLARSQGVATLASAFADQSFIDHEVRQMSLWLSNLNFTQ